MRLLLSSFLNSDITVRNNIMSLVNSLDEENECWKTCTSQFWGEGKAEYNLFQVLFQFFITFARKIRIFFRVYRSYIMKLIHV